MCPWDGNGNVSRTNGTNSGNAVWQDDRDDGVNIRADRHDTHDEDLANSIENAVALDGQNTTTTDNSILAFLGGVLNKFTGIAIGTNELVGRKSGDLTGIAIGTGANAIPTNAQIGAYLPSITDTGTDTYEGDFSRDVSAGETVRADFGSANTTTTPSLENTGGTPGALTITTRDGSALWAGAIDGVHTLQYDSGGSRWLVLDPAFYPNPTIQTFTLSGTWNRPAGCKRVVVEVVGAGGGGGGVAATSSGGQAASGGGGGSGGYSRKVLDVTSTASSNITVGAGGPGGSAGVNSGANGGASNWSDGVNTISANGGNGGLGSVSRGGKGSGIAGGDGGAAGVGGDVNAAGSAGGSGVNDDLASGGSGAGSMLGGGAVAPAAIYNSAAPGNDGEAYGSGGSGGASENSGSNPAAQAGGNGADGIVIVTEYY